MNSLRDVVLDRDQDGMLMLRWEAPAGLTVEIGAGATPEPDEHVIVATAAGGALRLDPAPPHRYVSLRAGEGPAIVVAERRVRFDGITNLRDLGGYATADGGTTRWGRVFRADALHKLTAGDLTAFDALGIATVYDLRSELERGEFPNPCPSQHVPIVGRPADAPAPAPSPSMTTREGEERLRDLYVGALEHSADAIGSILRGIAAGPGPVLFHCHGGKDRTGIVAAVLLLTLGVDRELVLDDYEATRRYRLPEHQQDSFANMIAAGIPPEAAAGVLGTPRWAMAAAVDAIEGPLGGIEAYLDGPAGVDAATRDALRDLLLVRHPGPAVERAALERS